MSPRAAEGEGVRVSARARFARRSAGEQTVADAHDAAYTVAMRTLLPFALALIMIPLAPQDPSAPSAKAAAPAETKAAQQSDVESVDAPVELALARPVTVAGSVLDAWTELGLERASVSLVSASVPPVVRSVESDEEGRFVVPRLFAGRWTLELAADGHVSARSDIVVRASRWEEHELPAVSLEPGARVEGDVVDRLGQVTAGVLVEVAGDEEDGPRARTDERGHFVLDGLAPGEHVLVLGHPSAGEAEAAVAIVRGREPSALVVHLPGRAEGGASGAAVARRRGVPLEVALEDGEVVVAVPHGRLAAAGVLPGDALEAVDGEAVGDLPGAEALLAGAGPAVLTLVRGGERFYLRADRRTWTPR